MSKSVYCSQCGARIEIFRKALKNYGRIIDVITPHECTEEVLELDLDPLEIPTKEPEGKFVQNLNNLRPSSVSTADLRDRRLPSEVKSTAPDSIVNQIANLIPSVPENEPEGSE